MKADGLLKDNKLEGLAKEDGAGDGADRAHGNGKSNKKNSVDRMPLKSLKSLPKEKIIKEVSLLRKELRAVSDEAMAYKRAASALPDQGPFLDPIIWAGLCGMGFDFVSDWLGDHWKLTKAEGLQLGAVLDPVAQKYMPAVLGTYQEECAAAAVIVQIAISKMGAAPKKEVKNEVKPSGDSPGTKGKREK